MLSDDPVSKNLGGERINMFVSYIIQALEGLVLHLILLRRISSEADQMNEVGVNMAHRLVEFCRHIGIESTGQRNAKVKTVRLPFGYVCLRPVRASREHRGNDVHFQFTLKQRIFVRYIV